MKRTLEAQGLVRGVPRTLTQLLFKTQKHHPKTAFDHATYDDERNFEPTEKKFLRVYLS